MESCEVAAAAECGSLPFAVLRVISDEAAHDLPEASSKAIGPDGKTRFGAVALSTLQRPQQIPDLLRMARRASVAFRRLFCCLDLLGPGLACPYLG
jgi:hypothetical protein